MKTIILSAAAMLVAAVGMGQVNPQTKILPRDTQQPISYNDITTGKPIQLQYNAKEQTMYNSQTNKPVDFFINGTGDTISSKGFYVVNNMLSRGDDQQYNLDKSKTQMRGTKVWGIKDNRELALDKNWELYRGPETKPLKEQ